MSPLHRDQLDVMPCHCCGKAPHGKSVNLSSRCHKDAGVRAKYNDGVLNLFCNACGKFIADLAVASQPQTMGETPNG